jgi:hypothetical protein
MALLALLPPQQIDFVRKHRKACITRSEKNAFKPHEKKCMKSPHGGWRSEASGRCVAVPEVERPRVTAIPQRERQGAPVCRSGAVVRHATCNNGHGNVAVAGSAATGLSLSQFQPREGECASLQSAVKIEKGNGQGRARGARTITPVAFCANP